jgi:hypothetical protein
VSTSSSLEVRASSIANSVARLNGGAFYAEAFAMVTLSNSVVTKCAAREGGVAFMSGGSTLIALNSTFMSNHALFGGGAFKLVHASLLLNR